MWADPDLAPRNRFIANLSGTDRHGSVRAEAGRSAACAQHGVSDAELSALITHLAFYGGFPRAITASAIAQATLSQD
jgi:4-carboxymuconolactone decarboxylase